VSGMSDGDDCISMSFERVRRREGILGVLLSGLLFVFTFLSSILRLNSLAGRTLDCGWGAYRCTYGALNSRGRFLFFACPTDPHDIDDNMFFSTLKRRLQHVGEFIASTVE